jgi:hypothetical protein
MTPGFLLPFGRRHSLLGSSCSRPGTGPSSRLADRAPNARTRTGFPRSAPSRYDRSGCLLDPGDGGALLARCRARPAPAASQRPVPAPRTCIPPAGLRNYGASTRVHAIHPSGLPLTCGPPDGTGDPWAYPCAPHPAVTGGARQGGAGPRARARNYATDIAGPPIREFTRIVRPRVATAEECERSNSVHGWTRPDVA